MQTSTNPNACGFYIFGWLPKAWWLPLPQKRLPQTFAQGFRIQFPNDFLLLLHRMDGNGWSKSSLGHHWPPHPISEKRYMSHVRKHSTSAPQTHWITVLMVAPSMDFLSSETSKGKDSVSFRGCSTKICSSCMQLPLTANHRFPEERRMEKPTRDVKSGLIEITRHPTTSDSQMTTYDITSMFSVVVIFPVFESMFFPSSKRPPKTQKTVWSPLVGITVCI